jgi:hypothetical protein
MHMASKYLGHMASKYLGHMAIKHLGMGKIDHSIGSNQQLFNNLSASDVKFALPQGFNKNDEKKDQCNNDDEICTSGTGKYQLELFGLSKAKGKRLGFDRN